MSTWERWLVFLLAPLHYAGAAGLIILAAVFQGPEGPWPYHLGRPEPLAPGRCPLVHEGFQCVLDADHEGEHVMGGG